jgi:hypothetical protein
VPIAIPYEGDSIFTTVKASFSHTPLGVTFVKMLVFKMKMLRKWKILVKKRQISAIFVEEQELRL